MGAEKRYACSEAGCGKRFVRPEHLYRHRLNHRPKRIYHCEICQKDFVRLDLLQRHEKRHERGMAYRNSGGFVQREPFPEDPTDPDQSTEFSEPIGSNRTSSLSSSTEAHQPVEPVVLPEFDPELLLSHPQQRQDISQTGDAQMVTEATSEQFQLDLYDPNPSFVPEPGVQSTHQIFFDSALDSQGLTQELDWLFGNVPVQQDFDDSLHPDHTAAGGGIDAFSTSPGSTIQSHNSALIDSPTGLPDTWITVQNRTLEALQSLPNNLLSDSFFEPANLHEFFEIYFAHYNAHFPIIHRPSFSVLEAPPLLLIAIFTLGATLSKVEDHYRTAEKIHEHLRWLIFSSEGFQPPAPLSCLQALLIVQAYEKMFSSRKHHEMAHIFHGAVITLMRRGSSYCDYEDSTEISSTERSWHMWIDQESSKRVAFFAFIMDAQHSSIFGHTPALSVSDVRLRLPCQDALWDSPSPSSWRAQRSKTTEAPPFLETLRALLARQPIPSTCSPFARFILLHGLFSVTKHMQARDLTASDVDAERVSADQISVSPPPSNAGDNWKSVLDSAIETWSLSLLSQHPSICLEAGRPLQRMAHLTIHVNLIDFHTFAGARSLTGSSITQNEYVRAKRRIKTWSMKPIAKRTLSHCLLLLQETMFTRRRYLAREDNIALRPWCLYHAALVLWTYGVLVEGKSTEPLLGAEEYLVHMLSGLMGGLSQVKGANRTSGMISAVRDSLEGCRWELLQEAHATLGKMIDIGIDSRDQPG